MFLKSKNKARYSGACFNPSAGEAEAGGCL